MDNNTVHLFNQTCTECTTGTRNCVRYYTQQQDGHTIPHRKGIIVQWDTNTVKGTTSTRQGASLEERK